MKFFLALTFLILLMSCSNKTESSNTEIQQDTLDSKKTLLFFSNPFGYPCQVQEEILIKLEPYVKDELNIMYIKTSDKKSLPKFKEYKVEELPFLILLDSLGKEIKRFPAGVQRAAAIIGALE